MLLLENISLQFERPVLNNVSFFLKKGEIIGIVGASGDGKSSLLKIISGFIQASDGTISLNRKKVKGPLDQLIPGHPDIQLVNQDFGLDLYYTVCENVLNQMLYLPSDVRIEFANELIELVELKHTQLQQAVTLSGGEMQRLAIIRALAREPQVLLLDEPFAHLDVHLKNKLRNYIQKLAKIRKMICILVSHDGADVLEWCSKIHFISKGEIVRTASPQSFYFQPRNLHEGKFFGELNVATVDKKKVFFRPTDYKVDFENGVLELKHVKTTFVGVYLRHEFRLNSKNVIVLYSAIKNDLSDYKVLKIAISKPSFESV